MSRLLTLEEGIMLTKFARLTIETYIRNNKQLDIPTTNSESLHENRGVFVTLKKRQGEEVDKWMLRGCIGRLPPGPISRAEPVPLLEATRQAALSSALDDPRFPPVQEEELESILVEVSVLTIPKELEVHDRKKLAEHITVGKDGLIIEGRGWHRGLLLPQVAPEQGWNALQFLQGCCQKAGLPPDSYLKSEVRIYKFQAQIFSETSVSGEIIERTF
ncbi:MAG: TIGR00296 family protein [Candidatus Odinarchaeota archaeon]